MWYACLFTWNIYSRDIPVVLYQWISSAFICICLIRTKFCSHSKSYSWRLKWHPLSDFTSTKLSVSFFFILSLGQFLIYIYNSVNWNANLAMFDILKMAAKATPLSCWNSINSINSVNSRTDTLCKANIRLSTEHYPVQTIINGSLLRHLAFFWPCT